MLYCGKLLDAGLAEKACERRLWAVWQQHCDSQSLSLNAGACESPSQDFQHPNIRKVLGDSSSCRGR